MSYQKPVNILTILLYGMKGNRMIILLLLSVSFYTWLFLFMLLLASYYYITDVKKPSRRWTGLRYVTVLECI
jgi:hypothetical protein